MKQTVTHVQDGIVLNRERIYKDPNSDPIAERNFVIPEAYFLEIFFELFPDEKDVEKFLSTYRPETDGERIFQRARNDRKIVEEFVSYTEQYN